MDACARTIEAEREASVVPESPSRTVGAPWIETRESSSTMVPMPSATAIEAFTGFAITSLSRSSNSRVVSP